MASHSIEPRTFPWDYRRPPQPGRSYSTGLTDTLFSRESQHPSSEETSSRSHPHRELHPPSRSHTQRANSEYFSTRPTGQSLLPHPRHSPYSLPDHSRRNPSPSRTHSAQRAISSSESRLPRIKAEPFDPAVADSRISINRGRTLPPLRLDTIPRRQLPHSHPDTLSPLYNRPRDSHRDHLPPGAPTIKTPDTASSGYSTFSLAGPRTPEERPKLPARQSSQSVKTERHSHPEYHPYPYHHQSRPRFRLPSPILDYSATPNSRSAPPPRLHQMNATTQERNVNIDPVLSSMRTSNDVPELTFTDETLASATASPGNGLKNELHAAAHGLDGAHASHADVALSLEHLNVPQQGLDHDPNDLSGKIQPFSRSPELRVSHKLAERKRRKEMKDLFDELQALLPAERGGKSSKWEVLSKAIDFVAQIKVKKEELEYENNKLRRELDIARGGTGAYAAIQGYGMGNVYAANNGALAASQATTTAVAPTTNTVSTDLGMAAAEAPAS